MKRFQQVRSLFCLDGEVTFFPQMEDLPSCGSESQVSQMIGPSQHLRTSRHSDPHSLPALLLLAGSIYLPRPKSARSSSFLNR